jgi:hypothetical protein
MSKKQRFSENEKAILCNELNNIQRRQLSYLEEYVNDETARYVLFVVSWLKNLIATGRIDELTWDADDDSICTVDVD